MADVHNNLREPRPGKRLRPEEATTTETGRPLIEELSRLLAQPRAPRLAVELGEAAAALGVSVKFFNEQVRPELRVVRRGRRILVPVSELQLWLEQNSALTLAGEASR